MKNSIKLTESELQQLIKIVISEMEENFYEIMTPHDWEDAWFKLRRLSQSFQFPDFKNNFFSFGGLDFHYNEEDGSLILHPMFSDPYLWRDDYERGVEVLENYANKIERLIEESGLDIKFEMGPKFQMRISKK